MASRVLRGWADISSLQASSMDIGTIGFISLQLSSQGQSWLSDLANMPL